MATDFASMPLVPRTVIGLCSYVNAESVFTSCAVQEAGFYSFFKAGAGAIPANKVVKWIRNTAIERINEIQAIFCIVNIAAVFYYSNRLLQELSSRFSFSVLTFSPHWTLGYPVIPVAICAGTAFAIGRLISGRLPKPKASDERRVKFATVKEGISGEQAWTRAIHCAKLILNVAVACFAKNRLLCAVNLASTAYSLLKNVQIKWIKITKNAFTRLPFTKASLTYHMLALPTKQQDGLENSENIPFSPDHVYDEARMIDEVISNGMLSANLQLNKIPPTRKSPGWGFSADIEEQSMPHCPNAKDHRPLQNRLEVKAEEPDLGARQSYVSIRSKNRETGQALFERLYAVYDVARLGLTYLQTHPELAATVYKVQKWLLITDLIGLGYCVHFLYEKAKAKLKVAKENETKFNAAAVVVAVATVAFSYLAVLQINAYLRSAIVLKEALAQLSIAPDALKGIDIAWGSPLFQRLIQTMYLTRMTTSVALAYFSEQKRISLLSAAAQFLGFVGVTRLRWISLTQVLTYPLEKIVREGGRMSAALNEKTVEKVDVTAHYMVDTSRTTDVSYVRSAVAKIYDSTSKLFDKSSWNRYWLDKYYDGAKVSRKLWYRVTVQNPSLLRIPYQLPSLTDIIMCVKDAQYGWTPVEIQT